MKSLYIKPQKQEKNPIISNKYLTFPSSPDSVPGFLDDKQRIEEIIKSIAPCKTSPNIIPNMNGKVTAVKIAGLIS